jgi:hypothetical protein
MLSIPADREFHSFMVGHGVETISTGSSLVTDVVSGIVIRSLVRLANPLIFGQSLEYPCVLSYASTMYYM